MAGEIIVVFGFLGDFVWDLEEGGVVAASSVWDGELAEGRWLPGMRAGALKGLRRDITCVWY